MDTKFIYCDRKVAFTVIFQCNYFPNMIGTEEAPKWKVGTIISLEVYCPCAFFFFFFTEHHFMKGYSGSGGIAPRILDLGTRLRWVVSFTPRSFYPQGKSPWYALDRRLGGPQSRSGRDGEEKNSQPLRRLEPPIIQPISQRYTTELYIYKMCNKCLSLRLSPTPPPPSTILVKVYRCVFHPPC
jgi:hypothetical protein